MYYAIFIFGTLRLIFNWDSIVPVTRTCKCFLVLKVNTLLYLQYIHRRDNKYISTVVYEKVNE